MYSHRVNRRELRPTSQARWVVNMRRNLVLLGTLTGIVILFVGCGGGNTVSFSNTMPTIASISPTSVAAGSGNFALTLTGSGFINTSVVHFGGDALSPSSVVTCQLAGGGKCEALTVAIPSKDVSASGTINVSVANASLVSNTMSFTVMAPPAGGGVPSIISFSPMAAPAGGPSFPLTIAALNVASGATVNFGSQALTPAEPTPCFAASACVLQVQVPVTAIATSQTVPLSITNPGTSGGTSAPQNFLVMNMSQFPVEDSVNNASPAVPGNGASTYSSVSAGGELVVFDSVATNLDAKATSGHSQIYERTNCFGIIPNCTPQTTLISVAPDGSAGTGGTEGSKRPVISPDGRMVAFESDDTNLVASATQPMRQIYLRDSCNSIYGPVPSCTPQTTLVTLGVDGKPGNAPSANPAISGFGLFVAYQSAATNLTGTTVPTGVEQVYLYQSCPAIALPGPGMPGGTLPGCMSITSVVSLDATGNPGDKDSMNPSLDLIGLSLSFESLADNMVANTPGNGFHQVYLRSLCMNLPIPIPPGGTPPCPAASTQAISVDAQGNLGTGGDSITPSTGALGGVVAFASTATNLVARGTSGSQIFVRNTCFGYLQQTNCTVQTAVIPVANPGTPTQLVPSSNPAISYGNRVAFGAVLGPPSNAADALVVAAADVCFVPYATCTTLSVPVVVSNGANGSPASGINPAIDGAGLFVSFSGTPVNTALGTDPEIFLAAPFL